MINLSHLKTEKVKIVNLNRNRMLHRLFYIKNEHSLKYNKEIENFVENSKMRNFR